MKKIKVTKGTFALPKGVDFPVTIRFPFLTERISKSDAFGRRDVQSWYKKKRQVPKGQIKINDEMYEVIT
jgi:hypothetical protein